MTMGGWYYEDYHVGQEFVPKGGLFPLFEKEGLGEILKGYAGQLRTHS